MTAEESRPEISSGRSKEPPSDDVAAVLSALYTDPTPYQPRAQSERTRTAYARDWETWTGFHDWLAGHTGTRLANSDITVGTYLAFVTYLKRIVTLAPNTIERRVIGTTSEARRRGHSVPPDAATAAWHAVKHMKRADQSAGLDS
ncbi:hypothetical protein [Streptomyces diastaticus]|uniref:hypothetical protein n=1 Tax=Streptomyces diastaticus TaxID=1956 RepID=UPI0035D85689